MKVGKWRPRKKPFTRTLPVPGYSELGTQVFDPAAGYDVAKGDVRGWPSPVMWRIFWFLVEYGHATVKDLMFELGLPRPSALMALSRLAQFRLAHRIQISRPGLWAWRSVWGPSFAGLWYCVSCDATFLPIPRWEKEGAVKFCPYCGSTNIVQEPLDPVFGMAVIDSR